MPDVETLAVGLLILGFGLIAIIRNAAISRANSEVQRRLFGIRLPGIIVLVDRIPIILMGMTFMAIGAWLILGSFGVVTTRLRWQSGA